MCVQVVGSDGCHSLGDALRDLYAKHLLRKHFVLLNADTVTNADLHRILQTHMLVFSLFESNLSCSFFYIRIVFIPLFYHHRQRCAFDEGTAMTVVYKNSAPGLQTGLEVIVANDERTKRLLFHQRAKSKNGRKCVFPLEIFTENSSIEIRHDLIDAEISICSPSVLSLFADNFDFQSRDDFIRGLLINEEILASTIYVSELPSEQYATKVKDWQMYRIAR